MLEPETKSARPRPADRYRATIYDYTNNRTLLVDASLKSEDVTVAESGIQPVPSPEEFAEAVRLVSRHDELRPAIRAGRLQPHPPMPPLLVDEEAGGGLQRTVAVGLLPSGEERAVQGLEVVLVSEMQSRMLPQRERVVPAVR